MIAQRARESKRAKALKMARNIERLKKEGKCRECSVVVTRMDFAKILGKFTKVKIQYESSSPKSQKVTENSSPKSNGRLKNNENGLLHIQKNKHSELPQKEASRQKKSKSIPKSKELAVPKRQTNNILRENNVLKKETVKNKELNLKNALNPALKHYTIIFSDPKINIIHEITSELSLTDILPKVDNSILPSSEWCIDFFPKTGEIKEDKVYDRIAAELEDLMRTEQPIVQKESESPTETKTEEFPSIMDILNDNTNITNLEQKDQNTSMEYKTNLDSSDVEAMLLGRTEDRKESDEMPMEVDSSDINKIIENAVTVDSNSNIEKDETKKSDEKLPEISIETVGNNPGSPSILDETLKNGIKEQLPNNQLDKENVSDNSTGEEKQDTVQDTDETKESNCEGQNEVNDKDCNLELKDTPEEKVEKTSLLPLTKLEGIMYVTFKKIVDGKCLKSVTCPKNLKYTIELDQKSVEFIGAPKYISTLDDLEVLLQIVNESELNSPYVLC